MTKRHRKAKKKTMEYLGVVVIGVIIFVLIYSILSWPKQPDSIEEQQPDALIADHLSETNPNETFIENARTILRNAGFKVIRYRSVGVNVDFFRDLPSMGFDIILLRVHSAINENSNDIVFFTSETFDQVKAASSYLSDFLADPPRLVKASIYEGSEAFFGITPSFVETMNGKFNNTLIIMMGCTGLEPSHISMANALINKGARVYIGYDGLVSTQYTDHATTVLLQKLVTENKTVQTSVTEVNNEVGSDPDHHSKLSWYPTERGDHFILARNHEFSLFCTAVFSGRRARKSDETLPPPPKRRSIDQRFCYNAIFLSVFHAREMIEESSTRVILKIASQFDC